MLLHLFCVTKIVQRYIISSSKVYIHHFGRKNLEKNSTQIVNHTKNIPLPLESFVMKNKKTYSLQQVQIANVSIRHMPQKQSRKGLKHTQTAVSELVEQHRRN